MREQVYQAAIRQLQQDRQRVIGRRGPYQRLMYSEAPIVVACRIAGGAIVLGGLILTLIGVFGALGGH